MFVLYAFHISLIRQEQKVHMYIVLGWVGSSNSQFFMGPLFMHTNILTAEVVSQKQGHKADWNLRLLFRFFRKQVCLEHYEEIS